jgi:hypothetical protein
VVVNNHAIGIGWLLTKESMARQALSMIYKREIATKGKNPNYI